MRKASLALIVGLSLSLFSIHSLAQKAPPPTVEEAVALLQDIETRFAGLQSLRYQASRTSQKDRQSQSERWLFTYRAPDCIRIDYHYPQERMLVINSEEMWEYVPWAQRAMRTDFKRLSPAEKQKRIAAAMARVSVDGLHPGAVEAFASAVHQATTSPLGEHLWVLEGLRPKFSFELDSEKKAMIKSEIYDLKGQLTLKTEASDFKEVLDGFWFPQGLKNVYHDGKEFVTSAILLEQVELNPPLADSLFSFRPPARVKVIEAAPR